jgi:hypothetical protein
MTMPGYMNPRYRMKNPLIRPMPALLPLLRVDSIRAAFLRFLSEL